MEEKQGSYRNSNIELLRIICIILVIFRHYCTQAGWGESFGSATAWTWQTLFIQLVGSLGHAANNIFILITGYYMIRKKVNWKKIIALIAELFFYSWIIAIILFSTKMVDFSIKEAIKALFPIWFEYNWFVGCYIVFCCFIPFINYFLNTISQKTYKQFLMISILLLHLAGTLRARNYLGDTYSVDHFFVIYAVGGYIQKYGIITRKQSWKFYFSISLVILLSSIIFINALGTGLGKDSIVNNALMFTSGSSILSVMTMVFLFLWIVNRKPFNNIMINRISRSVVGVFIIHHNPLLRKIIWDVFFPNVDYFSSIILPIHCIAKVLFVFTFCLLIDQIRLITIDNLFQKGLDKHWGTITNKTKGIFRNILKLIPFR